MELAMAPSTELYCVPFATVTLPLKVSVPEMPFGAVEVLVVSAAALNRV